MKKIAVLQSNYIPWKGYFDMIAAADEFIFFDDMQYTRRDWRNRNKIKTPQGLQWLTVPVLVKGKYFQKIRETEIDGEKWKQVHWKAIEQNYSKAHHFRDISEWLEPLYFTHSYKNISELNHKFIQAICDYLHIKTKLSNSWDYVLAEDKTDRLVELCIQAGGGEYISGPAAKEYINENAFINNGVKLTWFDYSGYQPYKQLWGEFEHKVSILDVLFNCGEKASDYMKCP